MEHLRHPFDPVFDKESRILILGTMPSIISRKENFYYGHVQNRFWKVLSRVLNNKEPKTIEEKKDFLIDSKIAVWDVLKSCRIEMSKDSSIKEPVPNNLNEILSMATIRAVFTNGKKADELYKRLCYPVTGLQSICLPSTSPANGQFSPDKLIEYWSVIKEYL